MSKEKPGFRYLNKQGVESDSGFAVQFTGRFSLRYRCGTFCLECDCDSGFLGGVSGVVVEVPPLPHGNLTPDRRSEIIREIREALDFMGLPNEVT